MKRSVGLASGLLAVYDNNNSVGANSVILEKGNSSQIVKIWDCPWLQNLPVIPICYSTEMTFSGDQLYFAREGEAAPHRDTAPRQKLLLNQQLAEQFPCHRHTLYNQQVLPVSQQLKTVESIPTNE